MGGHRERCSQQDDSSFKGHETMRTPTRRDVVVASAGLAAAFGLGSRLAVITPARAQRTPAPATPFYKYRVGAFECTAVYDGIWEKAHDPAFFKNASVDDVKAALKAAGQTDEFVPIPFTPLVVSTGRDLVLLDAGTGGQVQPTAGKLIDNMKAAGIDPSGITTIMISHFHPDHIFGLMARETNAQLFPNAEIVVSVPEYRFWTDPAVVDKLPEARRSVARRIQATFPTWKNIRQVEGEVEVAPGIRTVATPGHTPGHIAFHLASGDAQMIYSADTFYQPAFSLRTPEWQGAFDQDGPTAVQSRRRLADRLVADKIMVSGYHFPWPGVGTLARDGTGYALALSKA
jgi:glyoxylase-like metal-dependent hydrolase (beta-lactamase superfamily II)